MEVGDSPGEIGWKVPEKEFEILKRKVVFLLVLLKCLATFFGSSFLINIPLVFPCLLPAWQPALSSWLMERVIKQQKQNERTF